MNKPVTLMKSLIKSGRAFHVSFNPFEAVDMARELYPDGNLSHVLTSVNILMPAAEDGIEGHHALKKHRFHIGQDRFGNTLMHVEMEKNDYPLLTDEEWAAIRQGLQAVGTMYLTYNNLMMQEDSFHLVWRYEWS